MSRRARDFLAQVQASVHYRGQIVCSKLLPQRPARYGELEKQLPPPLEDALRQLGIEKLYAHQAEALNAIRRGENVVIATGPASGKTLCYHLPTLEFIINEPDACALYIYPTKALAQDQLRAFRELFNNCATKPPVRPFTYDGDTPAPTRRRARSEGNVILTNPDMLHSGILPAHDRWSNFFPNLKLVVLDELHVYRGVFGSHVANVLRRLKRICKHYGSMPQFICASATIANPKEHAEHLTGTCMTLIDEDGSPCGAKLFAFWNPPPLDAQALERRGANAEAAGLIATLIENQWHTITFTRTRNATELILRHAQDILRERGSRLADAIRGYRAGYLPQERREIEQQLFSGQLMGVVATSALELGIDVGALDACVLVGYPGTIASLWQRAGRVGRGTDDALVFLIAQNTPIDQYLMHHPEYIFERSPEHALIDPDNPQIVVAHLRCAATELPLTLDELKEFGEYTPALIMLLEEMNELRHINDRWYWHGRGFPAADVDLRNIGENTYTIVDITAEPPRAIGTLDEYSAFKLVHPEAIYMHEGDTYFVEELNLDERVARVRRTDSDYFTWSVADTRIRIESSELHKRWRISDVHWGRVMVTETVFMFRKVKLHTWESLGYGRVSLPPVEIDTQAMWLIPPQAVLRHVREYQRNPAEAMLAVANVVAHVVPLFVMADMADVGALVDSANTGVPTLFVYDAHAGGIGFAQKAYELIEDILRAACELINSCPCEDGCPSCVGAPSWYVRLPQYIDGGDLIPDKEAAKVVLHDLLQLEPYTPKPKRWRDAQRQTAEATPSPLHTAKPLPEKIEAEIRRHIANIQQRRYRR